MSKGNLLLGTAANSVGDVTMYRREGAQISRVRVRKVKNPKTSAQCLQRSAFAPAAKFFSPLSIVLERSFEGLSKSKSYSKFLKNAVEDARANGWLLPKGTGFFPLPYKLSQGSLPSFLYNFDGASGSWIIEGISVGEAPTTIGELSNAFIEAGYKNGDVITLITTSSNSLSANVPYAPVVAQFVLDSTSQVTIANELPGITFGAASGSLKIRFENNNNGSFAIIVARWENEKWRRSTQNLGVQRSILSSIEDADFKKAAIASYGNAAYGDNPLVYLDGEELND